MLRKCLACALAVGLMLNPAGAAWAQRGIKADQGGPTVNYLTGGTAVVDINKPNAGGLSHNKYQQFDVYGPGAILNNSVNGAASKLGDGNVGPNQNLGGTAAKRILNEVNGPASQLGGSVEVGGQKADVIIANPSGIVATGGEFINAGDVTLTTRKPTAVNADGAVAYSEPKGDVTVERGRLVNLGGALNVEGVHVDVKALGGMYAGSIKLVGTSTGLGVNNAGLLLASGGDVAVTSGGQLQNTGNIDSQRHEATGKGGNTTVTAAGKIVNKNTAGDSEKSGIIQSQRGKVTVESGAGIDNQGVLLAGGDMAVKARGNIDNSGQMSTGGYYDNIGRQDGSLTVESAAGSVTNIGSMVSSGTTSLAAALNLDNRGVIEGRYGLFADAGADLANSGRIISTGDARLAAGRNLTNAAAGVIEGSTGLFADAGADLANSGRVISSGAVRLVAGHNLTNAAAGVIEGSTGLEVTAKAGDIDNSGRIISSADNTLAAGGDITNTGVLEGYGALRAAAVGNILSTGRMITTNTGVFLAGGDFTNTGVIESFDDLVVKAGGSFRNEGVIITSAAAYIQAQQGFINGLNAVLESYKAMHTTAELGDLVNAQDGRVVTSDMAVGGQAADGMVTTLAAGISLAGMGLVESQAETVVLSENGYLGH